MAAYSWPAEKYDHEDHIDATCTSKVELKITDSDGTMDLEDYANRNPEPMVNWNRKQRRKQQKILKRLIKKARKYGS